MNLERCGVRVEVRVVLHRQTVNRLPQLGRFLARNLPFVEHVALMGLEMMGYVRMNLDALWIDPADYQPQLTEAVRVLLRNGMVAVGTAFSRGPPHRSVREELPHTAPTAGDDE